MRGQGLLDRVDTPPGLAAEMVAASTLPEPALIADFAAGGGVLLEAASHRWPQAAVVATDLDRSAVAGLRKRHPAWRSQRLDFTSSASRRGASLLAAVAAGPSVVLLNPPFSERGAAPRWPVRIGGTELRCGKALAFACWTVELLALGSELVCLLPAGILYSERDRPALDALAKRGELELAPCEDESLFAGYRLRTVVLRLRREDGRPARAAAAPPGAPETTAVAIARGQAKACSEASPRFRGPTFVHTTDLREGRVGAERRLRAASPHRWRAIQGHAVLLPRVGRPDVRKVCVWPHAERELVLSDCVIALRTPSLRSAHELAATLRASWSLIESCYGGTCAPYITLRRLATILGSLGVGADISSPAAVATTPQSPPSVSSMQVAAP